MKKLKSEQHHWWPECVSGHWAGGDGKTGWISPDGSCKRLPPQVLGKIGNGHYIKIATDPNENSHWDTSFEREFDSADNCFPHVISWLQGLIRLEKSANEPGDRFLSQQCTDEQLRKLTECVVSLAVRSPRNREASVSLAEHLMGPLQSAKRNTIIGANMMRSQRIIADSIGANAKFAVLFSSGKEFIFGDGFFHNVLAVQDSPHYPKILAPITPTISVIISRPSSYTVEPRLSTLVLSYEEIDKCNHAVQAYSRNALFFKSEQPILEEAFACGEHRVYSQPDNPIDTLINSIPGVQQRYVSMDVISGFPIV